jgi:hypothetical protein
LHEKLKQPDKVAQWKAELEVLPKPPQADSSDGSPQSVDRLSDDTESEK